MLRSTALGLCNFTRQLTKKTIEKQCFAIKGSRSVSTKDDILKERDNWVVLSDDGRTIFCWHPEVPFPYEHSKPLPESKPILNEGDSVLKTEYRLDDMNRYSPDGPTNYELQNITYTTKHGWLKKPEKKYRKPNPPRDREGI